MKKKMNEAATTKSPTVNIMHIPSEPEKLSIWHKILPPSLLAAITAIVYYPSLQYAFQFDDNANIVKNFNIRAFRSISWDMLFKGRWMTYWLNQLNFTMGRFDPFYFRATNLIIHLLAGTVLFYLILDLCTNLKAERYAFLRKNGLLISFITMGLFLLHPVQTQTVSYVIQGRLEGLAALFVLSAILCFVKIVRAKHIISKSLLTGLLVFLGILSCGAKEIAIVSPLLLLMVDWFFLAEEEWLPLKSRLWLHGLFFVVIIGTFALIHNPQWFSYWLTMQHKAYSNRGNVIGEGANQVITPYAFLISSFKVLLHYLGIFVWPVGMCVEYDWGLSSSFFAANSFFPFMILAALAFWTLHRVYYQKSMFATFGIMWFFTSVLPRSSVFPSPELICDYKTYLASAGWLFTIAVMLSMLIVQALHAFRNQPLNSYAHKALLIVTVMITFGYSYLTWEMSQQSSLAVILLFVPLGIAYLAYYAVKNRMHDRMYSPVSKIAMITLFMGGVGYAANQRNLVWESQESFWHDIILKAPLKPRAHNNYGVALSEKGDYRGSIPCFTKAIRLDKHYADPWSNLAVAYSMIGKVDDAIVALQSALKIFPYYPEAYNNLGTLFIRKKNYEKAEIALNFAIKLRPHYGKAYFNLARIHLDQNKQESAWQCYKKATEGDLDNKEGFHMLANMSVRLKKWKHAITAYNEAIQRGPADKEMLFQLANAYFMDDQFQEAKLHFQKLVAQNPHEARFLYNLGETLYANKEYVQALNFFEKVKDNKEAGPQSHFRIANCLERLNRVDEARVHLQQMTKAHAPDWFKEAAQKEINRFHATHGGPAAKRV